MENVVCVSFSFFGKLFVFYFVWDDTVCPINRYRDASTGICTNCLCDPVNSASSQCDAAGICECHANYTGDKCDEGTILSLCFSKWEFKVLYLFESRL